MKTCSILTTASALVNNIRKQNAPKYVDTPPNDHTSFRANDSSLRHLNRTKGHRILGQAGRGDMNTITPSSAIRTISRLTLPRRAWKTMKRELVAKPQAVKMKETTTKEPKKITLKLQSQ
jgi:hypothetical protein